MGMVHTIGVEREAVTGILLTPHGDGSPFSNQTLIPLTIAKSHLERRETGYLTYAPPDFSHEHLS